MTSQSSDHPNPFKDLDIPNLKIYTKYMASFVEAKIASYVESKGKRCQVQKATLYRYRYIGGPRSIALFPTNLRYCIVFSIIGLNEIIPKIPDYANCTVFYESKEIIVPIDDFIKLNYSFFSDVYNLKSHLDMVDTFKDNLLSEKFKKMLREWMIVAIDDDNNEFADKCPFLNLDFSNIILFERSKHKPENLESLLVEAVTEVQKIYGMFKKARRTLGNDYEIKSSLKTYYNEHRNDFNLVKEKFLNNHYLYSLSNESVIRRDFCGQLLVNIIDDHDYPSKGAQSLYKRMLQIEKANDKISN